MLFSTEFYLNPYFEKKLQKSTKSYNIINDYINFINNISILDEQQQIEKINKYINAITPKYDVYNYNNDEYWATPFEFFKNGGGDCEDYVISKMYTLNLLGISSKNMYFSLVKEKFTGTNHIVLSLYIKKDNQFLVLDNLSTKVLPLKKRVDLEPLFLFNEYDFYQLNIKGELEKINYINIPAFDNFKKRDNRLFIMSR